MREEIRKILSLDPETIIKGEEAEVQTHASNKSKQDHTQTQILKKKKANSRKQNTL